MRGEDRGEGVQTAADCETPGERPRQDRRGAAGREGLDPGAGAGRGRKPRSLETARNA